MAEKRAVYHHGDLRTALIDAALDIAREHGASGLRLREITRVAGVSPNAAYRHFADLDALILATALVTQDRLADSITARMASALATDDPQDRALHNLRAVGLGYIDFALKEPGWYELALLTFDPHAGAEPEVTVGDEVPLPFRLLLNALDGLVNAGVLTAEQREHAEWPCWSAVHGFADIATRGPLKYQDPDTLSALAAHVVESVIAGVRS